MSTETPLAAYNRLMAEGKACITKMEESVSRDSSVGAREWAQAARAAFDAAAALMNAKAAKAAKPR